MNSIELLHTTGSEPVDALIRGFIGLCETLFPERIRTYFLLGSYSDGSAVEDSDVDMGVLFKDSFYEGEQELFTHFLSDCNQISPLRLDVTPLEEVHYTWATPGVKAAIMLYGENVLENIPQLPLERTLPYSIFGAFHHSWLLRRKEAHLVYPLDYPDADGEFYGYERWGNFYGGSSFGPGLRILVNGVTMIATAYLGLKAQRQVGTKSRSVYDYKKYIDDEWAEYLIEVYECCKTKWRYTIPESLEDREHLRVLCERTLRFENTFFSSCRPTIIANLGSENKRVRQLTIQSLQRVAYIGDDVMELLEQFVGNANDEDAEDQEISEGAKEILETLTTFA